MNVVYTGGTFDLFHAGHVNFLSHCKQLAGPQGRVIVSLNPDDFVLRTKKVKVIPYSERFAVLSACKYVDQIICNDAGEDSKPAILSVLPNIIAIGTDWACQDYYKQMNFTQDWLDRMGITLVYIPYYTKISSSKIRELIRNDNS